MLYHRRPSIQDGDVVGQWAFGAVSENGVRASSSPVLHFLRDQTAIRSDAWPGADPNHRLAWKIEPSLPPSHRNAVWLYGRTPGREGQTIDLILYPHEIAGRSVLSACNGEITPGSDCLILVRQ